MIQHRQTGYCVRTSRTITLFPNWGTRIQRYPFATNRTNQDRIGHFGWVPRAKASFEVERVFGNELLSAPRRKFKQRIEVAFEYWRARGFPYPAITPEVIALEMNALVRSDTRVDVRHPLGDLSTIGLRVANAFHPQMWHVRSRTRSKSPVEYFNDDVYLRKALERTPAFWPNRRCWNAQCIRSAFRILAAGRVANFRPVIARRIVKMFCPENGAVVDFSAGYGGRLLGAISMPVHYLGIDPCTSQINGLRTMLSTLRPFMFGSGEVIKGCAEEILLELPNETADLLVSSPPYYDHEQYSSDETQSFVRYNSYALWRDRFLCTILEESRRVLKRGGFLAINVANTRSGKIADDTKLLLKKLFRSVESLRIPMGRVPSHLGKYDWLRYEPLFVCRKS